MPVLRRYVGFSNRKEIAIAQVKNHKDTKSRKISIVFLCVLCGFISLTKLREWVVIVVSLFSLINFEQFIAAIINKGGKWKDKLSSFGKYFKG